MEKDTGISHNNVVTIAHPFLNKMERPSIFGILNSQTEITSPFAGHLKEHDGNTLYIKAVPKSIRDWRGGMAIVSSHYDRVAIEREDGSCSYWHL